MFFRQTDEGEHDEDKRFDQCRELQGNRRDIMNCQVMTGKKVRS